MEEEHQGLGLITRDDAVELDAISFDVLMFTKGFVQQAFRRCETLSWLLEEEHGVANEVNQELEARKNSPQQDEKESQGVELPAEPRTKTRHLSRARALHIIYAE